MRSHARKVHEETSKGPVNPAGTGTTLQPGLGTVGESLVAHGPGSGTAPRGDMGPPSNGIATYRRPWQSAPRLLKLAPGKWSITFLVEKEPELVRDVEREQLGRVCLNSTHGLNQSRGEELDSGPIWS